MAHIVVKVGENLVETSSHRQALRIANEKRAILSVL